MAPDGWQRLGELLVARRVELGFHNRTKFAEAKGLKGTRIIAAIENVERQNFERATLAQIELAYEWEPGSIRRVLAGEDPAPIVAVPDVVYDSSGGVQIQAPAATGAVADARPPDVDPEEWDRIQEDLDVYREALISRYRRRAKQRGRREAFDDEYGAAGEENQDPGGIE